MSRTTFVVAAVFGTAFSMGAAHAQVYKCVDAHGKTVYSQDPCPANAKSTTISRTAPAPAAPATPATGGEAKEGGAAKAGAPKTPADQEQAFRKRMQEQQEAQKKDAQKLAESKEKEQNCNNARSSLAQYELGGRISRTDEKGERYFLDDNQVNQEKARARALVDQWCK